MRTSTRHATMVATLSVLVLFSNAPARAADGKPFLMKAGTGETATAVPVSALFQSVAGSASSRRSPVCASSPQVLACLRLNVDVTLATAEDAPGPWSQPYQNEGRATSAEITQAFVVEAKVPVMF